MGTLDLIRQKATAAGMSSGKAGYSDSPMYSDGSVGGAPGASPSPLAIQSGGAGGSPATAKALEASRASAMDGLPSKQRGQPSPHYAGTPGKTGQSPGLARPPGGQKAWA
jgi:hypothetical protein